jgi:glycosyltransferase involved in cell wall biosynthesis
VEIIVEGDAGEMTVGKKRNILLEKASGDYVCFVDDDDMVPDYYVSHILAAIGTEWLSYPVLNYVDVRAEQNAVVTHHKNPDVVGLKGHYTVGDGKPQTFIHSLRYKEWKTVDGIYQRNPNHLNPVRRELALKARKEPR